MSTDLAQYHNPKYWKGRMPRLPKREGPGAPIALTPLKAGFILAAIAQGIKPKPAFLSSDISPGTYNFYQNVRQHYSNRIKQEMALEQNQGEEDEDYRSPRYTPEAEYMRNHPHGEYLCAYFELQEEAEQAAGLLIASARANILTGGSNKTIVTRTRTRTRQAVVNGQVVDLVDNERSTVEIERNLSPKLPRRTEGE